PHQVAVELAFVLVWPPAEEALDQQTVSANVQPHQSLELALARQGDQEGVGPGPFVLQFRFFERLFDRLGRVDLFLCGHTVLSRSCRPGWAVLVAVLAFSAPAGVTGTAR